MSYWSNRAARLAQGPQSLPTLGIPNYNAPVSTGQGTGIPGYSRPGMAQRPFSPRGNYGLLSMLLSGTNGYPGRTASIPQNPNGWQVGGLLQQQPHAPMTPPPTDQWSGGTPIPQQPGTPMTPNSSYTPFMPDTQSPWMRA